MRITKAIWGIVFASTLCMLHGEQKNTITEKIAFLQETNIVEISNSELTSFYDTGMKTRVIKKLHEVYKDNTIANALIDYITVDNYKIMNVIKLKNGRYFLNYWVRSDDEKKPQQENSAAALGRHLYNHHVFFIYNPDKKQISSIKYTYSAYSLLLFHVYLYDGNAVLYGIGNNSSFGMARTDIYFLAFSTDNLELLFSECIDFSQAYYSDEIDDIAFQKDFIFNKNTIRFLGKDFNFDLRYYKNYDKTYTLP
ncbi:MAG: hypothetical protein ACTTH7_08905 [Treponema sp.]